MYLTFQSVTQDQELSRLDVSLVTRVTLVYSNSCPRSWRVRSSSVPGYATLYLLRPPDPELLSLAASRSMMSSSLLHSPNSSSPTFPYLPPPLFLVAAAPLRRRELLPSGDFSGAAPLIWLPRLREQTHSTAMSAALAATKKVMRAATPATVTGASMSTTLPSDLMSWGGVAESTDWVIAPA